MDDHKYRLVVEGELGPRFAEAFNGMEVTASGGQTEIVGDLDRAKLRAVLDLVDDLGLTLVSVIPDPSTAARGESPQ